MEATVAYSLHPHSNLLCQAHSPLSTYYQDSELMGLSWVSQAQEVRMIGPAVHHSSHHVQVLTI